MNVLVLGSGGREHALCWKISQSPKLGKLYVAPGNPGMRSVAEVAALSPSDFEAVGRFCLNKNVGLVVVGPEQPLADGLVDFFRMNPSLDEVKIFGPTKSAAQLESSKHYAKQFMLRNGIPTGKAFTVTASNISEGLDFLNKQQPPYVLKADGLAAGKGVIIVEDKAKAEVTLRSMLDGQFGEASSKVLIEEFLEGTELSVFVLTNGRDYIMLPEAKDYKRIGEGNTGANTGGMGAISPVPFASGEFMEKVEAQIVRPTIKSLQAEGVDYLGFIFFGLINVAGQPYVIEYNVRLGDPETQAVLPRLQSDLLECILRTVTGDTEGFEVQFSEGVAATVIAVSEGYPGSYEKGKVIEGLDAQTESLIFHAGTKPDSEGRVVSNGGRVLAVTALGSNQAEALQKAYEAMNGLCFEGMYYRKDIGFDI